MARVSKTTLIIDIKCDDSSLKKLESEAKRLDAQLSKMANDRATIKFDVDESGVPKAARVIDNLRNKFDKDLRINLSEDFVKQFTEGKDSIEDMGGAIKWLKSVFNSSLKPDNINKVIDPNTIDKSVDKMKELIKFEDKAKSDLKSSIKNDFRENMKAFMDSSTNEDDDELSKRAANLQALIDLAEKYNIAKKELFRGYSEEDTDDISNIFGGDMEINAKKTMDLYNKATQRFKKSYQEQINAYNGAKKDVEAAVSGIATKKDVSNIKVGQTQSEKGKTPVSIRPANLAEFYKEIESFDKAQIQVEVINGDEAIKALSNKKAQIEVDAIMDLEALTSQVQKEAASVMKGQNLFDFTKQFEELYKDKTDPKFFASQITSYTRSLKEMGKTSQTVHDSDILSLDLLNKKYKELSNGKSTVTFKRGLKSIGISEDEFEKRIDEINKYVDLYKENVDSVNGKLNLDISKLDVFSEDREVNVKPVVSAANITSLIKQIQDGVGTIDIKVNPVIKTDNKHLIRSSDRVLDANSPNYGKISFGAVTKAAADFEKKRAHKNKFGEEAFLQSGKRFKALLSEFGEDNLVKTPFYKDNKTLIRNVLSDKTFDVDASELINKQLPNLSIGVDQEALARLESLQKLNFKIGDINVQGVETAIKEAVNRGIMAGITENAASLTPQQFYDTLKKANSDVDTDDISFYDNKIANITKESNGTMSDAQLIEAKFWSDLRRENTKSNPKRAFKKNELKGTQYDNIDVAEERVKTLMEQAKSLGEIANAPVTFEKADASQAAEGIKEAQTKVNDAAKNITKTIDDLKKIAPRTAEDVAKDLPKTVDINNKDQMESLFKNMYSVGNDLGKLQLRKRYGFAENRDNVLTQKYNEWLNQYGVEYKYDKKAQTPRYLAKKQQTAKQQTVKKAETPVEKKETVVDTSNTNGSVSAKVKLSSQQIQSELSKFSNGFHIDGVKVNIDTKYLTSQIEAAVNTAKILSKAKNAEDNVNGATVTVNPVLSKDAHSSIQNQLDALGDFKIGISGSKDGGLSTDNKLSTPIGKTLKDAVKDVVDSIGIENAYSETGGKETPILFNSKTGRYGNSHIKDATGRVNARILQKMTDRAKKEGIEPDVVAHTHPKDFTTTFSAGDIMAGKFFKQRGMSKEIAIGKEQVVELNLDKINGDFKEIADLFKSNNKRTNVRKINMDNQKTVSEAFKDFSNNEDKYKDIIGNNMSSILEAAGLEKIKPHIAEITDGTFSKMSSLLSRWRVADGDSELNYNGVVSAWMQGFSPLVKKAMEAEYKGEDLVKAQKSYNDVLNSGNFDTRMTEAPMALTYGFSETRRERFLEASRESLREALKQRGYNPDDVFKTYSIDEYFDKFGSMGDAQKAELQQQFNVEAQPKLSANAQSILQEQLDSIEGLHVNVDVKGKKGSSNKTADKIATDNKENETKENEMLNNSTSLLKAKIAGNTAAGNMIKKQAEKLGSVESIDSKINELESKKEQLKTKLNEIRSLEDGFVVERSRLDGKENKQKYLKEIKEDGKYSWTSDINKAAHYPAFEKKTVAAVVNNGKEKYGKTYNISGTPNKNTAKSSEIQSQIDSLTNEQQLLEAQKQEVQKLIAKYDELISLNERLRSQIEKNNENSSSRRNTKALDETNSTKVKSLGVKELENENFPDEELSKKQNKVDEFISNAENIDVNITGDIEGRLDSIAQKIKALTSEPHNITIDIKNNKGLLGDNNFDDIQNTFIKKFKDLGARVNDSVRGIAKDASEEFMSTGKISDETISSIANAIYDSSPKTTSDEEMFSGNGSIRDKFRKYFGKENRIARPTDPQGKELSKQLEHYYGRIFSDTGNVSWDDVWKGMEKELPELYRKDATGDINQWTSMIKYAENMTSGRKNRATNSIKENVSSEMSTLLESFRSDKGMVENGIEMPITIKDDAARKQLLDLQNLIDKLRDPVEVKFDVKNASAKKEITNTKGLEDYYNKIFAGGTEEDVKKYSELFVDKLNEQNNLNLTDSMKKSLADNVRTKGGLSEDMNLDSYLNTDGFKSLLPTEEAHIQNLLEIAEAVSTITTSVNQLSSTMKGFGVKNIKDLSDVKKVMGDVAKASKGESEDNQHNNGNVGNVENKPIRSSLGDLDYYKQKTRIIGFGDDAEVETYNALSDRGIIEESAKIQMALEQAGMNIKQGSLKIDEDYGLVFESIEQLSNGMLAKIKYKSRDYKQDLLGLSEEEAKDLDLERFPSYDVSRLDTSKLGRLGSVQKQYKSIEDIQNELEVERAIDGLIKDAGLSYQSGSMETLQDGSLRFIELLDQGNGTAVQIERTYQNIDNIIKQIGQDAQGNPVFGFSNDEGDVLTRSLGKVKNKTNNTLTEKNIDTTSLTDKEAEKIESFIISEFERLGINFNKKDVAVDRNGRVKFSMNSKGEDGSLKKRLYEAKSENELYVDGDKSKGVDADALGKLYVDLSRQISKNTSSSVTNEFSDLNNIKTLLETSGLKVNPNTKAQVDKNGVYSLAVEWENANKQLGLYELKLRSINDIPLDEDGKIKNITEFLDKNARKVSDIKRTPATQDQLKTANKRNENVAKYMSRAYSMDGESNILEAHATKIGFTKEQLKKLGLQDDDGLFDKGSLINTRDYLNILNGKYLDLDKSMSENKNDKSMFQQYSEQAQMLANEIDRVTESAYKLKEPLNGSKTKTKDNLASIKGNVSDITKEQVEDILSQKGYDKIKVGRFDDKNNSYKVSYNDKGITRKGSIELKQYANEANESFVAINEAIKSSSETQSFASKWAGGFKDKLRSLTQYFSGMMMIMRAVNQVRQGFSFIQELNSQLTTINQTMSATSSQLKNLGDNAIDMGISLGADAKEVLNAVAIYANANETAESILNKAKPTVMLANASGTDTSTASTQLQAVTQQFSELEGQEERVVNSYEKISAGIAMDFQQGIGTIAEGVQTAGSVADQAGMKFEDFAASVAKVAEKTRMEG